MALIKCKECGKEFSNKASVCPNCSYPLKREKAKQKWKKILFQSKQFSFKILIMVFIAIFMIFSIKLIYQHFELKHKQEIISKYIGGDTTDFINKVWKNKNKDYYETYEFKDNYTCEYYKSGYTFEFNGETLPSFSSYETYYYKVEMENNNFIITVFEIDFDTEHINTIDTLTYFPSKTTDNLYFNEKLYGDDNKIFLPDDKPYYENINK